MKTVLLTGGTGAIGSALIPMLLSEERTHLRVLIRARTASQQREKVERLLRFLRFDSDGAVIAGRVEFLAGDVCRPLLGLSVEEYERSVSEVTHFVHAAGNVRLNEPLSKARDETVGAARQVVAFAQACRRRGHLRKVELVSTVGVAGRLRGNVPESPLPKGLPFRNTYEAAKAEAEEYLFSEIARGLPATVHRPSMVVGDSRTGRVIHFQVFYYLSELLTGSRTFGLLPRLSGIGLDVAPCDYVARAIQISSNLPDAIGRVFHLCSGPDHVLPVADLARRVREIRSAAGEQPVRTREIPHALFRALLMAMGAMAPPRLRRTLQTVPFFLEYLREAQTFENRETRAFLSRENLDLPAPEQYLDRLLEYYLQESARRAPRQPERSSPKPLRLHA